MKKLTLNLEALSVESFTVAGNENGRGTLAADAFLTGPENCVTISCGDSVNKPCLYA